MKNVHLYLLIDTPTCFSGGRGVYYRLCDECFERVVAPLLTEKGWRFNKHQKLDAECDGCKSVIPHGSGCGTAVAKPIKTVV